MDEKNKRGRPRSKAIDAEPYQNIDNPVDLLPDKITLDALEGLPSLDRVPKRARYYLLLRALGLSYSTVADMCKCTRQNVIHAVNRYDPERIFYIPPEARKRIAVMLWKGCETVRCLA